MGQQRKAKHSYSSPDIARHRKTHAVPPLIIAFLFAQFVQHMIAELRKFGPFRLFATMRCEARNQGMKHLAMRSNWLNCPKTAAEGWCLMTTLQYRKGENSAMPLATVVSSACTTLSTSSHVVNEIKTSIFASWIAVGAILSFGRTFSLGDNVLVTQDGIPPSLGKIVGILTEDLEVVCVVQLYQPIVLIWDGIYGVHLGDALHLRNGPAPDAMLIFEYVTYGSNLLHSLILTPPPHARPDTYGIVFDL